MEPIENNTNVENNTNGTNTTPAPNAELQKIITDRRGVSVDSPEFQELLRQQQSREYPDFGRDVPEGVYLTTRIATQHVWKSPRRSTPSNILTLYLLPENGGSPVEVAFAAFCDSEYPLVNTDGTPIERHPMLQHFDRQSDRNRAIVGIAEGTRVRIYHRRGHYANPYAERVFDHPVTWVERA